MNNLYTSSGLLTIEEFHNIEQALEVAWSKETTYPDSKKARNEIYKAFGQCAVTALIIYDLYGGKIIYDKVNFHLWNELPDGTEQDFSRKQFIEDRTFSIYKYQTKEDVLNSETGQRTNIEERYKLLNEKFQDALNKLDK